MKPVRALVAALAIAFAAPLSAQPGIDDPGLMAWMQSANAAQEARFEQLVERGDAPSLLMAMYLVHPMFPLREDPEREIAQEQARAWSLLARAAQADPDDPVVAWKLATCPTDSGLAACGSPASRERLATLGKARVEVNLYLAQLMQAVGDEAAFEAHLQSAAEAQVYGAFDREQAELIWRAWEGIEFPETSQELALSYARHAEIDPEAFVEQLVAVSAVSRIVAETLPNLSFPLEACGVSGEGAAISALRRRQCVAILTTMADDSATLIQRIVGEQAMVRMGGATSGSDAWKARLRTTAWVHEAAGPLSVSLSTRHDPEYFSVWREEGEYQSLLRLMERRGVALSPPEGWLPANEGMRGLLGEDVGDPDAAEPAQDKPAADAQPE